MGRNQKLFSQLDSLEDEYLQLISSQFDLLSNGDFSTYIDNKRKDWGHSQSNDAKELERLENKIIGLQEKLGTSYEDSPLNIPNEFVAIFNQDIDYWDHRQYVAKLFKEKLDSGLRTIGKEDINISNIQRNPGSKAQDILLYQSTKNIKAIKNYTFPISLQDIHNYIEANKILRFNSELIAVEFINPKPQEADNGLIFSLDPDKRIIVYSVPKTSDKKLVELAVNTSLLNIKKININHSTKNGAKVEYYNFFLNKQDLTIEKHDYKYESRKYRSGDKFSHSYKPKLGKTRKKQFSTIPLL